MRTPISSAKMIGREADLEALRAEYRRSADEPRAVALGGEAGIGKTRLVSEFAAEVSGEAIVLTGRCVDFGAESAPYAPFVAIIRELAAAIGTDALLEAAGPARAVLTIVLPELASAEGMPQRTGSERLYELIAVLFENVAREHRLVLIVEDIHWADRATIELLRFLVGMLTGAGILIVATYRSDEIVRGHPLRPVLPELERTRRLTRWELSRLTRKQVAAQVAEIVSSESGIDAAEIDELFERSEGVPFFVEELAGVERERLHSGNLPETLRELLLARYDRLDEPTQRMLRLLAVGGLCVDHDLLDLVHQGSADELDAAVRSAVDGGLLVVCDTGYDFRHALVRTAILGEVLPGERVRYHTAFADALESIDAGGGAVAHEIAQHRLQAHDPISAFPATLEAMRQGRKAYAFARAAKMGEQALELWEHVPDPASVAGMSHVALLEETALSLRDAGDGERALAVIDEALRECDPTDVELRAELLADKARYLAALSRPGSTALLEEALASLDDDSCSDTTAVVLNDLAGRLMLEARYHEAVDVASQALEQAQRAGSLSRQSVAHNIRGVSLVGMGRIDDGLADLQLAGELAATRDGAMLRYRVNTSDVMHLIGRYSDAVELGNAGAERAKQLGVQRTSGVILASNTVEPLAALGRWDEAVALLEPALALTPPPGFRVHLQRMKLWLLTWSGDPEAADELFRVWNPTMSVQSEIEVQSRLGGARVEAEIALALGDVERAWRAVSVLLHDHRAMSGYDLPLLADAARALTLLRSAARRELAGAHGDIVEHIDLDSAESGLREVLASASHWPTAPVWAPFFEAELRDGGASVEAWRLAVGAAMSPLAPAHLEPYARFRLAQALVALGDRHAAQQESSRSRVLAQALGSGLIVRWLDEFADRAGLESGGELANVRDATSQLTDRERQVLDLIAQGMTNKQIGERLYISTKTASVHVSAILRKLGATSRTEAAYLARREPTPA